MRALLLRRRGGLEGSADVVTECGVGQDGQALARVECGGRHCDCCSKAGCGCLVVGWRSRKIGGDVVIKSMGWTSIRVRQECLMRNRMLKLVLETAVFRSGYAGAK